MRIVFAARYRKIVIYKYSKKAGRQKITFQSSEYVVVYETVCDRILPDWNAERWDLLNVSAEPYVIEYYQIGMLYQDRYL